MVPSLIILLFFLLTVHGSKYNIVSRRELEVSRAPSASPQLISFDGDLDYIIAQALARAGETSESPELSDSPSLSPSDVSTTSDSEDASVLNAFKCTNEAIGHLEILTFKYSIETALGANVSLVIGEVQEILLEAIAPSTLSCRNESNKFANIVAMDSSVPADTPSTEGKSCICDDEDIMYMLTLQ